MKMRYISSRFEQISSAIDITLFDRESNLFLRYGLLFGVFALGMIALIPIDHKRIQQPVSERRHPIPVRLIEIPREPQNILQPTDTMSLEHDITEPKPDPPLPEVQQELPTAMTEPPEQISPVTELSDSENEPSILREMPETNQFSPFRDGTIPEPEIVATDTMPRLTWEDTFHGHPDIIPPSGERQRWETSIPLSENSIVFLSEGYGTVFWDPLNPLESEPEDERRRFDPTFLGLPMGRGLTFAVVPGMIGFNATGLLPSLQHFVKRKIWEHNDAEAASNRMALQEAGFIALTEQDIRYMILLWHYEQILPGHLKKQDRDYLNEVESREITTHRAYLENMAERGLAVSLQKSGEIVYKAAIGREEMLSGCLTAIIHSNERNSAGSDSLYADSHAMLTEYVQLIQSYEAPPTTGVLEAETTQHTSIDQSTQSSVKSIKDPHSQVISD